MQNLADDRRRAGALEWPAAGDHLVEHKTEREDVRARIGVAPFELLGRHDALHGSENHT